MIYVNMGVPADLAIKLAFGTDLLVVLPTAISGTWRHFRRGDALDHPLHASPDIPSLT